MDQAPPLVDTVPSAWKRSFVTPVHKSKGARSDARNYRPISITVVPSKVLETILSKRIVDHCESNRLFDQRQFGFRRKKSTVLQLVDTISQWYTSFDNDRAHTDAIYIDFSAAFDVVNHRLLLLKLPYFGFSPVLCSWFKDFLTDRTFSVRVGDSRSSWSPAPSGVPQGSVVGPLLLLLFSTDLQREIVGGVSHRTYADDTKIFADVSSPLGRTALQNTLTNIEDWSVTWKLKISSAKSAVLHILHSQPAEYTMFGEITPVYVRAYRALILPVLLYGSEVWRPWFKRDLLLPESFQKRFIRRVALKCSVCCDSIDLSPISALLDEKDRKLAIKILHDPLFDDFLAIRDTLTRASKISVLRDAFRAHLTKDTDELRNLRVDSVVVLGGCTKFVQAPDVNWNKPFKQRIEEQYEDWLLHGEKSYTPKGNMRAPPMDVQLKCIVDSWSRLTPEIIAKFFMACGISNAIDGTEDHLIHVFKPDAACPNGLAELIECTRNLKVRDEFDSCLGREEEEEPILLTDDSLLQKTHESDISIYYRAGASEIQFLVPKYVERGQFCDLSQALDFYKDDLSRSMSVISADYELWKYLWSKVPAEKVTTSTAERDFSVLKLLKTDLRSTMKGERLSGLTALKINREMPLTVEEIVDYMAANPRKLEMVF
ncbi:uncharacterized protein LOC108864008 [Galendromus occidentalis]|uniref:Uncharacterized protein LOC108864008 n=1 Tax=Galendromus occidentalis TaxID=34638 RepID=A0AAJ7WI40_9ACAR|nr:uncharacterized protein LOC108864008 [Galendromus occidentalis]